MTYVEKVENFINRWGMITHRKIMQITGCNCPYSGLLVCAKDLNLMSKKKELQQAKSTIYTY